MNIVNDLKERKILYDITDPKKILSLKGKGVYIGFDPTAASLHLGNFIQIMTLLRFKKYGYKPVAVLGGATAMIGDPSGKSSERNLLSEEQVQINKSKIKKQLSYYKIDVVDNYDFYKDMNVLYFLRHVGKLLNINYMISKDVVKSRLESGISFTEFSYQLIQGWDFHQLYTKHDVCIQIGGSDQWGNITAGLEIIRKKENKLAIAAGVTTNLLLKSNGTKFGKTENNKDNIWLDPNLTSTFKVYQYLLNQPDSDVKKLLNWITFLTQIEIKEIMKKHLLSPYLKLAQKRLAKEVTIIMRGQEEFDNALKSSDILFSKTSKDLINDINLSKLINDIPTIKIKSINILDALIETSLAISKREAKEFINNNAIYVNGELINDQNYEIKSTPNNKEYALIKCGKRKNSLVNFK